MKKVLTLICLLGILPGIFAQSVQVTVQAPKVVELGEQFELEFSVNAEASSFNAPDMRDFRILMGPSKSQSSSIQVINGKTSQSMEVGYGYVLQASKTGKFQIGAAEVNVNGKRYRSTPFTIEVVGSGSGKASQGASSQSSGSARSGKNQSSSEVTTSGDVFMRVLLDKKSAVQGEYLTATVKLYSKVQVANYSNFDLSVDGFFKQEISSQQPRSLVRENVNGQVYGTAVLKKYILIPQKSGNLTIPAITVDCIIQQQVQSRSRGFFDDFFGSSVQEVQRKLKSLPVTINVKPLPSNTPASFNGAVGRFSFDAKIDKNKVKTNDAITLKLTVSGNGNIKLLDAPKVNFPTDFDTYDPKVTVNASDANGGISGSKTFEYLIIPRNPGDFKVPPVAFSYFDVSSNQFKTLTSKEFSIHVEKGADAPASNLVAGATKEDVKFIGKDILFIKTNDFKLSKVDEYFFGSHRFYMIYLIGMAIFAALVWMRRRIIRQNSNIELKLYRTADKFAKRRLKQANVHRVANEPEKFYQELLKGLWGYLSYKLTIPQSELSRNKAQELLTKRKVDTATIQMFIELADICEFARYAPASARMTMHDDYKKAIDLISKLQQKLK
ncbi:MAG: BatD family protein [Bacteroidota bacterium]|nr:BatD family protein [Bacteroidota bacterium]